MILLIQFPYKQREHTHVWVEVYKLEKTREICHDKFKHKEMAPNVIDL
jgi:hypothetical protein